MSNCCPSDTPAAKPRPDYLLWLSGTTVVIGYLLFWLLPDTVDIPQWLTIMSEGIFELVNKMWLGLVAAVVLSACLNASQESW